MSSLHRRSSSIKAQGIPLVSLRDPSGYSASSALHSVCLSPTVIISKLTCTSQLVTISEFETVPLDRDNIPHHMETLPSKRSYDTMMTATATSDDKPDIPHKPLTPRPNISTHLRGDIDPEAATLTLIAYCFMTGFVCVSFSGLCYVYSPLVNSDSVTFSAAYVWCGFQTGNGTQVIQNDF